MPRSVQIKETALPQDHCPAALQQVTKRYPNGVVALEGLSLSLQQGDIVALLGPNGAGKSTAIKLLMGLTGPSSGRVEVFGQDPRHSTHRLRMGAMLQVGRAPETLRVREHLDLFRGYYPHPLPVAELVRVAGLSGLEERFFGQLSGGQKQRVLFALALAGDPDLVFLDEPTVGLDIEQRRIFWEEIRMLAARGKTVLLTTHYLEEADALASRILVMTKGRIVCEGTPTEVKAFAAQAGRHAVPQPSDSPQRPSDKVKVIRCITTLGTAQLGSLPGVSAVDQPPRELYAGTALLTRVTTTSPERTLRELLALDAELSGLEVAMPALEDAFLALTRAEPS